MIQNKNVIVLKSAKYLISGIKRSLKKSNDDRNKILLKKESEFFISNFKEPFNERLLKLVSKFEN